MLQRECLLYTRVLEFTRKLAAGIDDAQWTAQPAPGLNSPLWILGHLTISTDLAAGLLGLPMVCPEEWHQMFGPGSDPAQLPANRPTADQLLAALEEGHAWVSNAALHARAELLAEPHAIESLRQALPTKGDLLAHLMTTHPTLHLGQLSAWRRLQGLPPVAGF